MGAFAGIPFIILPHIPIGHCESFEAVFATMTQPHLLHFDTLIHRNL